MFLIIVNALFLGAGLALVIYQTIKIASSKVAPPEKIKIYTLSGYVLVLIAFVSIALSIVASRPLLISNDFATIITAVGVAVFVYVILLGNWFFQKKVLGKTIAENKISRASPYFGGLTERFLNLAVYGLIYAFAVIFFVLVAISQS
ncbi:MAG: hypothetical protein WCZ85_02785 [Bacilli bacterium]